MPKMTRSSTSPSLSLVSAVLAAALAFAPSVARAEPPPTPAANPSAEQLERAKELFENGKGLFREGSYDTAIAAFKSAYAQSGDPVLLYNIALAYDRANNFDAALEYLEYYRAFAPESERASLAEKEDSLRKRRLRAQTDAAENPPEAAADATPEETTDEPALTPSVPPPTNDTGGDDQSAQPLFTTPVWILSSVAVVGVGVGAGLGAVALGTSSDAESACGTNEAGDPLCPASAQSDSDTARRLGVGADVAFGVGAVAGVVAIALIINNAVKRKKPSNTAFVPSRGGAGLSVRF